ncbi:phenylacetate--CoA ligase family protein [Zavarzinella formosa]|uniref:phenylacetate--CoA ligase family protein n=1 Tax=Zavarzinella formosa TaxID=360055 RepID=UPI0003163DEB|nr:AMP-binding protein [Zavarzinella formosa]
MTSPSSQERLDHLLRDIVPKNAFYSRKFAGCDLGRFDQLPFTAKVDLVRDQLENPPYGSTLTFSRDHYSRLHQSSGTSTGRPLRWLDTPDSWNWLLGCWSEMFAHLGLTRSDVFFFPFSFGPFLGFWTAFEAAAKDGYLCLPGGGLSSTARLRFLLDHRATVICCTPTYALHLAELAAAEGLDLAGSAVRMLIVAGEPGGGIPATRKRIEEVWGARVYDHYGLTEVGPSAIEATDTPGSLIVLESQYVAEVIDPAGTSPVADGQPGELVLTNLGRHGSPLIRYRTGDVVKARRTPDGKLLLDGGILGRTDDMIHLRGNNVYPAAIEAVIRRFPAVVEFRITVDRTGPLTDLGIEIEPIVGHSTGDLREAVSRAIRDELLFRADVIVVSAGSLPRYEMKAKRVVVKQ